MNLVVNSLRDVASKDRLARIIFFSAMWFCVTCWVYSSISNGSEALSVVEAAFFTMMGAILLDGAVSIVLALLYFLIKEEYISIFLDVFFDFFICAIAVPIVFFLCSFFFV